MGIKHGLSQWVQGQSSGEIVWVKVPLPLIAEVFLLNITVILTSWALLSLY